MPALTVPALLSPLDDPPPLPSSRDPPNPYPRPPSVPLDDPRADGTPSSPYHDRLRSPSPPSQFTAPPPSSSMSTHFAHPDPFASWRPYFQILDHNPYPPQRPSQLVHKVWILDCRSCGTFLTNRGMRAVLLLRPNVPLFSTDALPVNCSAYSTNPDALRPPPCRPSVASSPPRTCECLTQTLCCHTCGAPVGYMIVIPCSRCTSSISATNRATNGHRFVFHSSEIVASERHHIPDEPGVLPVEYPMPPPPPSSPPPLAPAYPAMFSSTDVTTRGRPSTSAPSQASPPLQTSSPSSGSDYIPSPQFESSDLDPLSSPGLLAAVPPTSSRRPPRPFSQTPLSHHSAPYTLPETRGTTPESHPRKLKAGDVLYWHHLTKHGEIPGVEEDSRARISNRGDPRKFFDR